ncbi:dUTP diphosphatase [bacterium]|nr:dUTP diphosphatase [bacterium]
MNNVNVKLLEEFATIPTRANENDAGWDLYSIIDTVIPPKQRKTVKTGIALEMPEHMAGLIWPRSGLSVKQGIDVLAGVIDSGYRGEIMVCLYNTSDDNVSINRGDRIAQIIFQEVPRIMMFHQERLGSSQRGDSGFGSTGT